MRLSPEAVAAGFSLREYASLDSTNDEAMRAARVGAPGLLWIVAGAQTGGRGRLGRAWASPPGNLYASLLLIDPAPAARCAELGFVAGVALAQATRALAGGDERLRLKWPNDLMFGDAKLSGMLLESTRLPDGRLACVVGCGVNCRSHPSGLAYPTTDLSTVLDRNVSAAEVFARLSARMADALVEWRGGAGFARIRQDWLALAHGLNRPLRARLHRGEVTGLFQSIDEAGRLILLTDTGPVTVEAGDIFPIHDTGAPGAAGQRHMING